MTSTSSPLIDVCGVSMQRGTTPILRGVNWCVAPGQHWVILGANGCGKTSLLRAVTAYEWPTEGHIRLFGETLGQGADVRLLRRKLGWVSSAVSLLVNDYLTGLDVACTGPEAALNQFADWPAETLRRAREALQRAAGSHLENRLFAHASAGERQRMLVARALAADPRVLILDEACAGLDPIARADFLSALTPLATADSPPTTLVMVTHHVEEIGPWATHALLLAAGRVVAQGPVEEVLTSNTVSETFGRACRLHGAPGRFSLVVE